MQFIDDAWAPLATAAEVAGVTPEQIVARLNERVLRGYQDSQGNIFVHKDELPRLREDRIVRERERFTLGLMVQAHYDNPADQAAHEARFFGKPAKGRG